MKIIKLTLRLVSGLLVVAGIVLFGCTSPVWQEQLGVMLLGMALVVAGGLLDKLAEGCVKKRML